jgi:hypothetical protein
MREETTERERERRVVEKKKKLNLNFLSRDSNLNFQTMSVYCILFGCGGGV